VFCDIDPNTLTADPEDVARRITPRTKAIVVVHIWGNPAAMDRIMEVANAHQLAVVEDCSHAHGAAYQSRSVGSWGDVGCFSLQGGKAVSAGEGGVAVTKERHYYERMLALGFPIRAGAELENGRERLGNIHLGPKYRPHLLGIILALSSLDRLAELNRLRRRNWNVLTEGLKGCPAVQPVASYPDAIRGGFLEFKLIVHTDRLACDVETFVRDLKAEGVPVSVDRYGSLHRSPILRRGGPLTVDLLERPEEGCPPMPDLPHLESLEGRIITLPAFTRVKEAFVRQCAAAIQKVARVRASD
jgi:dTDP-4-amino-4,6-dideoxygalactose transaminase